MTKEEQIQKGFNHGYQLQKHLPSLASTIQQGFTEKEVPYAQGFIAGSQEYIQEKTKEKEAYNPQIYRRPSNENNEKGRSDTGFEL